MRRAQSKWRRMLPPSARPPAASLLLGVTGQLGGHGGAPSSPSPQTPLALPSAPPESSRALGSGVAPDPEEDGGEGGDVAIHSTSI